MAKGFSSAIAASLLDAICNYNGSYAGTDSTHIWAKLHTAEPGAAGATAPAGNTTRKEVSFGAASGGSVANDQAVTWTSVSTTETYSHVSLWTAESSGSFLMSGTITANQVTAGDTFTIAIGGLTVTLNVAA